MAPAHVDATAARRRLQALACLGYSCRHLALAGGPQQLENIRDGRQDTIRRDGDAWLQSFYLRHENTPAPTSTGSAQAISRARRNDWAPPGAWDPDTIGDPEAVPQHNIVGDSTDEGEEFLDWLLDSLVNDSAIRIPQAMTPHAGRPGHPFVRRAARALHNAGRPLDVIARQLRTTDRFVHRATARAGVAA